MLLSNFDLLTYTSFTDAAKLELNLSEKVRSYINALVLCSETQLLGIHTKRAIILLESQLLRKYAHGISFLAPAEAQLLVKYDAIDLQALVRPVLLKYGGISIIQNV